MFLVALSSYPHLAPISNHSTPFIFPSIFLILSLILLSPHILSISTLSLPYFPHLSLSTTIPLFILLHSILLRLLNCLPLPLYFYSLIFLLPWSYKPHHFSIVSPSSTAPYPSTFYLYPFSYFPLSPSSMHRSDSLPVISPTLSSSPYYLIFHRPL